jgi:hypothetical protein
MSEQLFDSAAGLFKKSDRCFNFATALVLGAITLTYCWLITYGSGNFFTTEFPGKAYDSIGEGLLHGDVNVHPRAAKWESFRINGKLVMYFGPLPGFLRLIPNALFPEHYGQWPRLSLLVASLIALLAVMAIISLAFSKNDHLTLYQKRLFFLLSLAGYGFASPLLFLMSCGFIYHEANIWGLCLALWGVFFTLRLLWREGSQSANICGLSAASALTLLSRVTFGVPLYLIVTVFCLAELANYAAGVRGSLLQRYLPPRFLLRQGLLIIPAIAALAFQLWYNHARYESIFTFADYSHYTASLDAERHSISEIGGMMNLSRIPFGFYNYFRIKHDNFMARPPFFRLRAVTDFTPGTYPRGFENGPMMNVISLLIVSPWLVAGALGGLWYLAKGQRSLLWWACFGAFFVQLLFVTSYYWIATRYSSEFLPILTFLLALFFSKIRAAEFKPQAVVFGLLVLFGTVTTPLSTLEYVTHYRSGIPDDYKELLRKTFHKLDWREVRHRHRVNTPALP